MKDDERKLYEILKSRFCRLMRDDLGARLGEEDALDAFNRNRRSWEIHVCRHLGARLTSIRRGSGEKFHVRDPASDMAFSPTHKPPRYIEMDRDVALKILVLGNAP